MVKKYDIVIIDSGVNCIEDEVGMAVYSKNKITFSDDDITDTVGHGTAVYGIIKTHNFSAECFHIKVFDAESTCIDEEVLISVLVYVYENIDCRIINMSLGLTIAVHKDELYSICQKLKEKGVILIAAFDNMEVISYPAVFENVIGVASSSACSQITDIEFYENSIVNVCGKGGLQRVDWITPRYIFTQGNSYACAHITGILSKTDCHNMEEALAYLKDKAVKMFTSKKDTKALSYPQFYKGSKAAIFPFNKEMHSLVRFEEMLCVEIADIYDVRQSARINASVNKLLDIDSCVDHVIKNIENITWDTFDTLILGHTDELIRIIGDNKLRENLILDTYHHGKSIYCFDDISDIITKYSLSEERIFYPNITIENLNPVPLGMLYRPWVPMLGVYGTTSKQGKFTLQLILRQKFLRDNYRVGQIGTEPSAYLFDMDLCFHFGYHSTTNLTRQNTVCYLNSAVNDISNKNVDIIISGCQSGTVTYDFGNVNYYTFSQTEFLLGTLPDAVILCINSYDEHDYIKRTVQFIEACSDSKVIALVIYPMGYRDQLGRSRLVRLTDEELLNFVREFSAEYNLPMYILGKDSDMESLYLDVVSFFTSEGIGQ